MAGNRVIGSLPLPRLPIMIISRSPPGSRPRAHDGDEADERGATRYPNSRPPFIALYMLRLHEPTAQAHEQQYRAAGISRSRKLPGFDPARLRLTQCDPALVREWSVGERFRMPAVAAGGRCASVAAVLYLAVILAACSRPCIGLPLAMHWPPGRAMQAGRSAASREAGVRRLQSVRADRRLWTGVLDTVSI